MNEAVSRREALVTLAGTTQAAQGGGDGGDGPSLEKRLQRLADKLMKVNGRLTAIDAGWTNPPDPDVPPVAAQLQSIIAEANRIINTAELLLARL